MLRETTVKGFSVSVAVVASSCRVPLRGISSSSDSSASDGSCTESEVSCKHPVSASFGVDLADATKSVGLVGS